MEQYTGEIITGIITAICGIGAWFTERKKRQTDNMKVIVDLYQEALGDLKLRYDSNLTELKTQYDLKFHNLEEDIKKLRENVNLWKGKYSSLKKEFDNYKKQHQ